MSEYVYTAEAARWFDYWVTRFDIEAGETFYVDGRVKIRYVSSRSDGETKMFAEVEQIQQQYNGKIKVRLDVNDRTPNYWINKRVGRRRAEIEYDPQNTRGTKTLGALMHIEWIESPAERAADRDAPERAKKVCPTCEADVRPERERCWKCDRWLGQTEVVRA